MTSYTNHTAGPRGINVKKGDAVTTRWIEPGETLKLDEGEAVSGGLPDLGKPADQDARNVASLADAQVVIAKLTAENDALRKRVAELEGAAGSGPDYERDNLKDVDITKPATSKDTLLVIAAYEQADVPQGDTATKADLIAAIQAKRAA